MSKSRQKKVITSSHIDFNNSDLLEKISGADYARAFYMMVIINRLDLYNTKIFKLDPIREFAKKYSPGGK